MDDMVIFDVAAMILACATVSLDDTTSAGAPARRYVAIGLPAHDDCCEGQLTVSLVRHYTSMSFPTQDTVQVQCGMPYVAIDLNVEIIRCAPTLDNLGRPPTIGEINASSQLVAIDALAVWNGVACCLQTRREVDDWASVMRETQYITPGGGCVGSRLFITVGLTKGCPCQ